MTQTLSPGETLGALDSDSALALASAASDILLILDDQGIVRDIACSDATLLAGSTDSWIGRPWLDMVTTESRPKVSQLLADAGSGQPSRWRQVNHAIGGTSGLPLLYATIRLGAPERIIAFGRDQRAMAALQQNLLQAQQSMERDYVRLRQMEARYRILFRTAPDAILMLDPATRAVIEANPSAAHLLGDGATQLSGKPLTAHLDENSAQALESLLTRVEATGRTEELTLHPLHAKRDIVASCALLRQDNNAILLLRLAPKSGEAGPAPDPQRKLAEVVEALPDGFVLTDEAGCILVTNAAFLEIAQLATEEQARGEHLERWLGRSGVDVSVLLSNLAKHGTVRLFFTTARGEYGSNPEVEISAVSIRDGNRTTFGFSIRDVSRRLSSPGKAAGDISVAIMPRSMEQLTELVGRVPLKELVRESTDVIERMCIEAALMLTGDNRASAAELLGLSRQSLYLKLRRYGLTEIGEIADKAE
ncbi:transcriptional regulator PpsR [Dongia mobilis]|uniref:Transcriptional regulator PpsR n=1 Tax=Dongia mobilis TaxID=578943 RepID=A0A4R6WSG5_9PROT|nr:transcriptional regulator PpsR [Dongia mobilis]TDQ82948.1 transcriptional regulator PpsR [Dongia mobilis]